MSTTWDEYKKELESENGFDVEGVFEYLESLEISESGEDGILFTKGARWQHARDAARIQELEVALAKIVEVTGTSTEANMIARKALGEKP